VLERLGPPEEIVEAAEPAPEAEQRPTGKLEVAAMVTLVVPFIGWLFGIAMVLISRAWTNHEKTIGTALALLAVVPFLVLAIVDSYSESVSTLRRCSLCCGSSADTGALYLGRLRRTAEKTRCRL
jgi:hypothetical protein